MTEADVALRTLDGDVKAQVTGNNIISMSSFNIGKILTILDASVTDKEQKNAMKALIKNTMWDTADMVIKWMSEQTDKKGSSFPV